MIKITLFTLIFSMSLHAETALHAHEHGTLALDIAVEGKNAELSVDGPAESFLGFEYVPKTAKDKKILADAKTLWTKNFFKLVSFDKSLNCKIQSAEFEQKVDEKEGGNHSDIEANAKIICQKDLAGSKAIVSLRKNFSHIKKLKVELVGSQTKSIEITKADQEIQL